jgi:hypothetical protein
LKSSNSTRICTYNINALTTTKQPIIKRSPKVDRGPMFTTSARFIIL